MAASFACLHGDGWSLVLECPKNAAPIWRHLGGPATTDDLPPLAQLNAPATFSLDEDQPMPAVPASGLGWFGPAMLALRGSGGNALAVAFTRWSVVTQENAVAVTAHDDIARISCTMRARRTPGGLTLTTSLQNTSPQPIFIDRLASAVLPLPPSARQIISWRGRHNAELNEITEPMPAHGWQRETRRGIPGHGGPCSAQILSDAAGHHTGLVLAVQLAWSGDARLTITRDDDGGAVLSAEALLQPAELQLAPGAAHQSPPLLLAISNSGRNGAVAAMHTAVRARLGWPGGTPGSTMRPRPVHLNSWEACYFAHDEARILKLAQAAASIGIERFILDDGWFAGRNNDRAGLGDWTPDPAKYPQGLAPLARQINALGMEFGLWVEPEMVNPDSDLYRAHPDWALALPGRPRPTARHQLVLDLARADVRDHLFAALDTLLREVPIAYLKWDHNRDLAPPGGAAQVEGTYALLARLRAAHPHIEIESCAGGGGRIDAGIAHYTHRFWTSDNIDALARVPIQRGFLANMPPELMGAHVGASPSHATGRSQPLDFRAAIAAQGHFGVELDPDALNPEDRERLAGWIGFAKQWRSLIHGGRTVMGEGSDGLLWQAQGRGDAWLLWVIRCDRAHDRRPQPIALPFAAGQNWQVRLLRHAGQSGVLTPRAGPAFHAMRATPQRFTGSWLAAAGLPLPALAAQSALIFHLEATL